jgi:hypothetical protein
VIASPARNADHIDFELDWEVQAQRAFDPAAGSGLQSPPADLLYMSALGIRTGVAFRKAADTVQQHGVKLIILDSIGQSVPAFSAVLRQKQRPRFPRAGSSGGRI